MVSNSQNRSVYAEPWHERIGAKLYFEKPQQYDVSLTFRRRYPLLDPSTTSLTLPRNAIRWTFKDQVQALDHGFFVHRSAPYNHATIIPTSDKFINAQHVLNAVERTAFKSAYPQSWTYRFVIKLLAFIKQQDLYGYRGAWDPMIQNYTQTLRWYKDYKRLKRERMDVIQDKRLITRFKHSQDDAVIMRRVMERANRNRKSL